jgi:hypothetical protein
VLITAVGLSGCDVVSEFLPPPLKQSSGAATQSARSATQSDAHPDVTKIILAFLGFEEFKGGTNTPTGPGTSKIADKVVTGPFSAKLPRTLFLPLSTARPADFITLKKLTGTFASEFDGETDSKADKASLTGITVLSFDKKSLGISCLKMSIDFTDGGTKGVGTFTSAGGTKAAGTVRASGTIKDTILEMSRTNYKDSGKITVNAKLGKAPKAPTAACKTLAATLP